MTDRHATASDGYDEYVATRDDARFTDWLRSRSEPDWTDTTTHRLTSGIGDGTLDETVFRRYLVQDYAFIDTLVGTLGHAVGQAPTMSAKSRLVDFLAVLTADEDDYFQRAFRALDVSESTYTDPELTATTQAFEDCLEHAARVGGYAETLAVIVPAEWIYLTWATAVADDDPSAFYFDEWIDLHTGDAFADVVDWLRSELDREGEMASTRRQNRIARLFERTVALEVAFFDAADDPDGTASGGGDSW